MIKKAIISSVATIVIVFGLLNLIGNWYINDGPSHLNDRPFVFKLFRSSTKVEGRMFFLTFFLLIFGVPIIIYVISYHISKILLFKKKKYICYKAIVENIDLKNNLYVKSLKDFKGHKLDRKHERNVFKDYKCIGINKKELINKEVILIIIPGNAYIMGV